MPDANRILERHGDTLRRIARAIYRRYGVGDRAVDAEDVYQECALALLDVVEKSGVAESAEGFYRCVYAAGKRRIYRLVGMTAKDPAHTGRMWRKGMHGDTISLNEERFEDGDDERLDLLVDPAPAVDAKLDETCLRQDVRLSVSALPATQRALVTGVFLEGAPLNSAAVGLGMTPAQARKALEAALEAMRHSPRLVCYGETARRSLRRRVR